MAINKPKHGCQTPFSCPLAKILFRCSWALHQKKFMKKKKIVRNDNGSILRARSRLHVNEADIVIALVVVVLFSFSDSETNDYSHKNVCWYQILLKTILHDDEMNSMYCM